MKYLFLLISINSLILSGCSHFQNPKENARMAQSKQTRTTDKGVTDLNSPSSIVCSLYLKPEISESVLSQLTPELKDFIVAYQKLETADFQQVVDKFTTMASQPKQTTKELGEFGLLMVASHTRNMTMMSKQLEHIKSLEHKSQWLVDELAVFNVLYHFESTHYKKASELIEKLPQSIIESNGSLASVQAWLYFIDNKPEKAQEILKRLKQESEDSIYMQGSILARMKDNQTAVDYLEKKQHEYPQSLGVALSYNNFLLTTNPKQASKNLMALGENHTDNIWARLQIAVMLHDFSSPDTVDVYNEQLQAINASEVGKNHIDYHISSMQNAMNLNSMHIFAKQLAHFNPMSYDYLLMNFMNAENDETKLEFLRKIEHIDPYDNLTLLELASYYSSHKMPKELAEVKQKFAESKCAKSEEFIHMMATFK